MSKHPQYVKHLWNNTAFIDKFAHDSKNRPDLRYAFVLGAGASVQSGIRPANALAKQWVDDLHARYAPKNSEPKDWATESTLGLPGFKWGAFAEHCSSIYDRRFQDDPSEGFAFLEGEMEGRVPSIGYSVLAEILAGTAHNIVITTNFDNLVSDAMAIYTQKLPLVCGHEALAEFAQPLHRRAIIAKIHRDLMLSPMSSVRRTSRLADSWSIALHHLFRHYTPLFIGYGGNDGSLMGYLEALEPGDLPSPPYWCYYEPDGLPSSRIVDWVIEHSGVLVPIAGFDELLIDIAQALNYSLDKDKWILLVANERANAYQNQANRLDKYRHTSWLLQAAQQKDPADRLKIIEEGISVLPSEIRLLEKRLDYLLELKMYKEAETGALELMEEKPERGAAFLSLASALTYQGRFDEAEKTLLLHKTTFPNAENFDYNMACLRSIQGDLESSLRHLELALAQNRELFDRQMREDPDLQKLRSTAEYSRLEEQSATFLRRDVMDRIMKPTTSFIRSVASAASSKAKAPRRLGQLPEKPSSTC